MKPIIIHITESELIFMCVCMFVCTRMCYVDRSSAKSCSQNLNVTRSKNVSETNTVKALSHLQHESTADCVVPTSCRFDEDLSQHGTSVSQSAYNLNAGHRRSVDDRSRLISNHFCVNCLQLMVRLAAVMISIHGTRFTKHLTIIY